MLYLNDKHIDMLTKHVPCPSRLNLELTTMCNIKCIMCRGSKEYKNKYKSNRYLDYNSFIKVLEGVDLRRLKALNFAGNSEPLINPDIVSIIALCKELGIFIEMITNGMMLTPSISEQLLFCTVDIHVSFGGASKNVFESIRRGADFDLICANISHLNKLKKQFNQSIPRVWLNPIMMVKNVHELEDTIKLAKDLGCYGVAFSHLIVDSPELIDESLFFHKEECNNIIRKSKELANRLDIKLEIPHEFTIGSDNITHRLPIEPWKFCRFLWSYAILGIEGIMPCCTIDEIVSDGDIFNTNFINNWNNDWYATMRYKLLTGEPPEVCINCRDSTCYDVNNPKSFFTTPILPLVQDRIFISKV
jgi:MoaA/NifB/PqqE/SkfB family radical SAM enzyme